MSEGKRDPLPFSVILVLTIYAVAESIGFTLAGLSHSFRPAHFAAFFAVQILFHAALAALMIAGKSLFRIEGNGKRLNRVNLANKVTILRISMLPSLLFLTILAREFDLAPILIPVIAATFLTDMIDGNLSRGRNEVTDMGKILDSVSDYSLLFVIGIAFRAFDLLPTWLFGVILFRLFFQASGMLALLLIKRRVEPVPTVFGKIAIATTMILFAAETLKLVVPQRYFGFFDYLEVASGIIIGVSILDKGIFFLGQTRQRITPPKDQGNDR